VTAAMAEVRNFRIGPPELGRELTAGCLNRA
jgi:hypothetical protein